MIYGIASLAVTSDVSNNPQCTPGIGDSVGVGQAISQLGTDEFTCIVRHIVSGEVREIKSRLIGTPTLTSVCPCDSGNLFRLPTNCTTTQVVEALVCVCVQCSRCRKEAICNGMLGLNTRIVVTDVTLCTGTLTHYMTRVRIFVDES